MAHLDPELKSSYGCTMQQCSVLLDVTYDQD